MNDVANGAAGLPTLSVWMSFHVCDGVATCDPSPEKSLDSSGGGL